MALNQKLEMETMRLELEDMAAALKLRESDELKWRGKAQGVRIAVPRRELAKGI